MVNPGAPAPLTRSYFVGIELENADLPAPYHGHVLLPSNSSSSSDVKIGPILLYALSPTTTRMLIDISSSKTPSKLYLEKHITSLLPPSVVPSFLSALRDDSPHHPGGQKIKSMPNSFLPPAIQGKLKDSKEGVLLAGDAMNMRHPLTGGGMSVALNDAVILTELLGGREKLGNKASPSMKANGTSNGHSQTGKGHANGNGHAKSTSKEDISTPKEEGVSLGQREVAQLDDWWDIRSRLEEWHWRRKGVGTCVNVLAMALYTLFAAEGGSFRSKARRRGLRS